MTVHGFASLKTMLRIRNQMVRRCEIGFFLTIFSRTRQQQLVTLISLHVVWNWKLANIFMIEWVITSLCGPGNVIYILRDQKSWADQLVSNFFDYSSRSCAKYTAYTIVHSLFWRSDLTWNEIMGSCWEILGNVYQKDRIKPRYEALIY